MQQLADALRTARGPKGYNHGAERLNLTNAELGFVAAHSWDIMGAASAGLPTFWIQRSPTDVQEELGFRAAGRSRKCNDNAWLQ
jgi:hypothetical protein